MAASALAASAPLPPELAPPPLELLLVLELLLPLGAPLLEPAPLELLEFEPPPAPELELLLASPELEPLLPAPELEPFEPEPASSCGPPTLTAPPHAANTTNIANPIRDERIGCVLLTCLMALGCAIDHGDFTFDRTRWA